MPIRIRLSIFDADPDPDLDPPLDFYTCWKSPTNLTQIHSSASLYGIVYR